MAMIPDTKEDLMACTHELDPGTCSIHIHGLGYNPWGTNPPTDYAAHLYDDLPEVVAPPRGGTNNPAPSEALYERALEEAYWLRQSECLACSCEEEGDASWPYYDDHTCMDELGTYVWRPRTTQWLRTVGRPSWVRTEFHRDAFLGFYRDELSSIRGFGFDPEFAHPTEA